jgi:NAD(P)-dependent dehydrogenase (short-subunit alcohol dehydrogenase family)
MKEKIMKKLDFRGRTVLITGAGRGLGLAYARAIGHLGATILVHDVGARRDGTGMDPAIAENAASSLSSDGIMAQPFHTPIDTRDCCHSLIEACLNVNGRLDAVIHNAGWVDYEPVEELEEASFDRMMTIAAKAPLWIAQAAWPIMSKAGYGRIVLTTSCRALYPQYVQKGLIAYAAAKMAAVGITNVLAHEGAAHGIVVNAVSPVAKTRMWGVEGEPDELKPETVAPGVAFLASPECKEGGWILRAANGQFHATRAVEADSVDYPRDLCGIRASTPNAVAEAWEKIAIVAPEPRS